MRAAAGARDGEGCTVLVETVTWIDGEIASEAVDHLFVVGLLAGGVGDDDVHRLDRQTLIALVSAVALCMGGRDRALHTQ